MDFFDFGEWLSEQKFFRDENALLKLTLAIMYIAMQAGGILLTLILFGYTIYKNVVPTPVLRPSYSMDIQSTPITSFATEESLPQLPDLTQETPTDQFVSESVTQSSVPTEITMTEAPTATEIPTLEPSPTPTTIVASIAIVSEDICSPIGGIGINELAAIISQPFNVPNPYSDVGHHGVDWGSYNYHGNSLYGNPIQAVFAGRVAGITVNRPPIGNTIIIETRYDELPERLRILLNIQEGQSLYHMYSHLMDPPTLVIGDRVNCGQMIGNLGKSQTAEAHLHFETRIGNSGLTIGNMAFYDTSATESEISTYLWWRTSGDVMPFDPMTLFSNVY